MANAKKGSTTLLKSDRVKIMTAVFAAIAKQAHEATNNNVRVAFEKAFQAAYEHKFDTVETQAAAQLLIKRDLIDSIKRFNARDYAGDVDQISIDSGVKEFNDITRQGEGKYYNGFAYWCSSLTIVMENTYPGAICPMLKYGDEGQKIRQQLRADLVDALIPYREFSHAAATVKGVITNAKSVEDLIEKAPQLKEVVLTIVNIPKPLPVVIDDKVGALLNNLKPIEV